MKGKEKTHICFLPAESELGRSSLSSHSCTEMKNHTGNNNSLRGNGPNERTHNDVNKLARKPTPPHIAGKNDVSDTVGSSEL